MSIKADFHLHSSFSGDSTAPLEEMVLSGIQKGLTHMCFTEHMDLHYPISEDVPAGFFEVNTDSYLYELLRLKEKYASDIHLSFGIELGLQASFTKDINMYARSYDFDFIIGSSHIVNGKDPYEPAYFQGRTEEESYREYFTTVIENIRKYSRFDVYGHLDYVVRYGPNLDKDYSYEKYKDLIDTMLTLLLEKEKGIELNSGSLRKGLKDFNPCADVLRRYRELGGEIITVGSDAHNPADVASHFALAEETLKNCGFKYFCVYEKRVPEFIKI